MRSRMVDASVAPAVTEYFAGDRFAWDMGVRIVSAGSGSAVCTLHTDERHLNADGLVQGGVIFTLADFTFAVAANSRAMGAVSLNVSISYLHPGRPNCLLTATATPVNDGRHVCVYRIDITDGDGRLIAQANATGFRKQQ